LHSTGDSRRPNANSFHPNGNSSCPDGNSPHPNGNSGRPNGICFHSDGNTRWLDDYSPFYTPKWEVSGIFQISELLVKKNLIPGCILWRQVRRRRKPYNHLVKNRRTIYFKTEL